MYVCMYVCMYLLSNPVKTIVSIKTMIIVSRDLCSVRYLSIGGADRGGVPSQGGDRWPLEKELSFSGFVGLICDALAQRPQKFATIIADLFKSMSD